MEGSPPFCKATSPPRSGTVNLQVKELEDELQTVRGELTAVQEQLTGARQALEEREGKMQEGAQASLQRLCSQLFSCNGARLWWPRTDQVVPFCQ